MKQKSIYDIGYEVLHETLVFIRNTSVFPKDRYNQMDFFQKKDSYGAKCIQEITDAIHNVPHSIQKQDEEFLVFELRILQDLVTNIDLEKIAAQNTSSFRRYCREIQNLLQLKHETT
ncbi:hypothetical protein BK704_35215 [[Bacillus thuringiensis] serovar konkukian]|nr:hypothetical protein [Bacillus thuringiensis]MED1304094.1 hypothetical protein [Bacillus pacificus]OUA91361.1 hypothetical protein BK704_35215 [[Bacillus thuringiensis] serovar konkukian]